MTRMLSGGWSTKELELLRQGISDDLGGPQLVLLLAENGFMRTRNAVLGQLFRMGLKISKPVGRPATPRPPKAPRAPKAPKPAKVTVTGSYSWRKAGKATKPKPVELPDDGKIEGVPFVTAPFDSCSWPIRGEGAAMLVCGASRAEGKPYCAGHVRRSAR